MVVEFVYCVLLKLSSELDTTNMGFNALTVIKWLCWSEMILICAKGWPVIYRQNQTTGR
jgi:hypothetical protein